MEVDWMNAFVMEFGAGNAWSTKDRGSSKKLLLAGFTELKAFCLC